MIVNPVAALICGGARAGSTIMFQIPTNQYLTDIEHRFEQDIDQQKNELDEFMTHPPDSLPPFQDVEIVDQVDKKQATPVRPPLPNTNNPLKLLGVSPGATFDDIRCAYKELAKIYHPDVAAGPDASPEEQKEANWDFARINSSYDILKRSEEEDQTRSVVTFEEYGASNDRIQPKNDISGRHPRKQKTYESDRMNGFEPGDSYSTYSGMTPRKKWWTDMMEDEEPNWQMPDNRGNWDRVESHNQFKPPRVQWRSSPDIDPWEQARSPSGVFGVNQAVLWSERAPDDDEDSPPQHIPSQQAEMMKDRRPKKGRPRNERRNFEEEARFSPPQPKAGFVSPLEKWWHSEEGSGW